MVEGESLVTRALVTSSKYSPGNMTPEALEALFVGREKLFKDVLNRLVASATTREKHFILLVGSRGIGKTHFVALLRHRLTHDPKYASARKRLKIAYLNEEEWGIASFLDFLVRILRSLAAGDKDTILPERIEQIYSVYNRDPNAALDTAQSVLRQYIGSQTLLLICENLLDIFEGIGTEGQKRWRSWMQEEPFWTILATTPAVFGGVKLQTSPFYGFFTIRHLEKLDLETATALLQRKAYLEKRPDLALALQTPTGRARVHAIHHLAGGNHRIYVTMSDFLTRESLDDLVTPFMRMIDDITPYYQDRMRQLAPQQRKIVEFLSHAERPIPVKDIAHRCLMSPQTAAKQLGELAKQGFVGGTKYGRETYYELAEPLMRICVEVKDNRTEHIKLFVEFLREWFTGRELRTRFHMLEGAAAEDRAVDRIHLAAALREYERQATEPVLEALGIEAERCLERQDHQGLAEAAERLAKERNRPRDHWLAVHALEKDGKVDAAIERARAAIKRHPKSPDLRVQLVALLLTSERPEQALVQVDRAIKLAPTQIAIRRARGFILYGLQRYQDLLREAEDPRNQYSSNADLIELHARTLIAVERYGEAELISRGLTLQRPELASSWEILARTLLGQHRNEEALPVLEKAIELDPNHVFYHRLRARALVMLGRFEEAFKVLTSAIIMGAEPDDSTSFYRGACLFAMSRFQEAINELDRPLQRTPRHWAARGLRADALIRLGRIDEAVTTCQHLLAAQDETASKVLLIVARSLYVVDRPADALVLTGRALELSPDSSAAWLLHGDLSITLGRYAEAEKAAEEARRLTPADLQVEFVLCQAATGAAGFMKGIEWLTRILSSGTTAASSNASLDELIAAMLLIEVRERGAVAMARQIGALRKALADQAQLPLLGSSLTALLRKVLRTGNLGTDEWVKAAALLKTTLSDLSACRVPLEMLSVAARYALSGAESVLLELPLEQRTLLLDAIAPRSSSPKDSAAR
jgi:tetratricopeptide (TPR) repeat protein